MNQTLLDGYNNFMTYVCRIYFEIFIWLSPENKLYIKKKTQRTTKDVVLISIKHDFMQY